MSREKLNNYLTPMHSLPKDITEYKLETHFLPLKKANFFGIKGDLTFDTFRTLFYSGMDPFISLQSRYNDCRANILHQLILVQTDEGLDEMGVAYLLAWYEYATSDSFVRREAYVRMLWETNEDLWPRRLSSKQWPLFEKLTPDLKSAFIALKSNAKLRISGEEDATMDKKAQRVKDMEQALDVVFENKLPTGAISQRAYVYKPLKLPRARGKVTVEHPSRIFSPEEFGKIMRMVVGRNITEDLGDEGRADTGMKEEPTQIQSLDGETTVTSLRRGPRGLLLSTRCRSCRKC